MLEFLKPVYTMRQQIWYSEFEVLPALQHVRCVEQGLQCRSGEVEGLDKASKEIYYERNITPLRSPSEASFRIG